MTFFFKNFHKNPTLMPIFGQKTSILLKLHYFMGIKVGCPFCSAFPRKNHCSHANIISKIRLFSKKTHCSHAHISQKNVHSLKNTMLSCVFVSWKTPAVVHMIGQKTSILSKLHSILGQKSHRMPFFSYFPRKNYCSYVNILSKKRPFSKKK